ncbi:MAG: hypothetical protein M1817_003363 [Caeruleum heppii]|nr:MAG: hypothetical protein M1817_003363 [Caeruleum heppii]
MPSNGDARKTRAEQPMDTFSSCLAEGKMTKKARKPAKLPVQQLVVLAICRLAEPIALTSVFPYLPEMMEHLGVEIGRVAFYAGLTSAIFSLCQSLTGIAWGRASDRFGRKPVILAGLICAMFTSMLFGFSRSLTMAMIARALAGLSSGNVGIIRTTVAEMVPQKELQPRAFSIMPLVWTVGSIFGPAFGGFLANPTERHPSVFGKSRLFKEFPYALPNMVASLLFLVGLSTGILFLRETLETHEHRPDRGRILGQKLIRLFRRRDYRPRHKDDEATAPLLPHSPALSSPSESSVIARDAHPKPTPSYREIFSRQTSINLAAYSLLALHSVGFDQLLPIFMHHPRQITTQITDVHLPFRFAGGFGLDSQRIGLFFALYGIFGMLVQFLIFPYVARRFGVLRCFKACALVYPVIYVLTPFTVLIESTRVQQIAMFILMAMKCVAVVFSFPCSTILLTNSAVSLRILGTLNGVATSISALGRAAGPAIGGTTFSLGVQWGYVIFPWWTLAVLAAIGAVPVWFLIEMEGFGGTPSESDDEDEEGGDDVLTIDDAEQHTASDNNPVATPEDARHGQEASDGTDTYQQHHKPPVRRFFNPHR